MNTMTRAFHMASQMADELLDYGPARSRLLVRSMRLLARGQPLDSEQIDELIKDLEIGRDEANQFLRRVTERDASDRIVGIMGLSLNDHPHHFAVNGVPPQDVVCGRHAVFAVDAAAVGIGGVRFAPVRGKNPGVG